MVTAKYTLKLAHLSINLFSSLRILHSYYSYFFNLIENEVIFLQTLSIHSQYGFKRYQTPPKTTTKKTPSCHNNNRMKQLIFK